MRQHSHMGKMHSIGGKGMKDLRLTSTWTGTGFSASPATGPASGAATPADLDGDGSGEPDGGTPLPLEDAIVGVYRREMV
jgi:hypothetical protein